MLHYLVYDVFTDAAFSGNPLAIVTNASGLRDDQMQTIAREFNLSETSFVFPPDDPENTARVRIFTPTVEMAFAGHPTVGTAMALYHIGRAASELTLELEVGPIPVAIRDGIARFTTRVPLEVGKAPPTDQIAACIGLPANTIRTDRHPPVLAGVGTSYVLAELSGADAFESAAPVTDAFRKVAGPEVDRLGILIYLRDGNSIRARMFQPLGGIPEDPATGSAAAALVAYLGRLDEKSGTFSITQGVEMGRPSEITAEVVVENGEPAEVAISGRAVRVMEGRLSV